MGRCMKVYLAGPMTGRPQFNFPAFDAAAAELRERGIEVVSPAEMDSPEVREAALASPDGAPDSAPGEWADFLARDIQMVCDPSVEAVVVLPGWEASKGATFETDVARRLGKPVLAYPDLEPVERTGEVRLVNAKTGGAKGTKPQRMELLPYGALQRVAEVYAFGAEKYEAHNWRKGYAWSLSFGAMQRHLAAFWEGEERDPESGLSHLAHAAFHVLGLLHFAEHDRYAEHDDRPA